MGEREEEWNGAGRRWWQEVSDDGEEGAVGAALVACSTAHSKARRDFIVWHVAVVSCVDQVCMYV